ncbi:hypothetical protein AK812_SmicGene17251 [Symbiodinium microadriaticum]|uniref:Uncharacterized protein n=1 Tax=Symbiodinium microadriaticum TaxID=2951 RepID=A0A1Q9DY42_SYMMI|nr:hypothetical protein AK812_SmicGene17251 [Symbiodinium microadriaticum]
MLTFKTLSDAMAVGEDPINRVRALARRFTRGQAANGFIHLTLLDMSQFLDYEMQCTNAAAVKGLSFSNEFIYLLLLTLRLAVQKDCSDTAGCLQATIKSPVRGLFKCGCERWAGYEVQLVWEHIPPIGATLGCVRAPALESATADGAGAPAEYAKGKGTGLWICSRGDASAICPERRLMCIA